MVSVFFDRIPLATAKPRSVRSEHRSWREVGWIFRDGQIFAIERRGIQTRARETLI